MKKISTYLWELLFETSTPLWVTLVGFCIATFGVYYITPLINANLEKQKIKTEYVIRSLDNINTRTQEMLAELSVANRKIVADQKDYSPNIDKALRLATELQWKAIEIGAVLEDKESARIIENFQQKLDATYEAISKVSSPTTAKEALKSVKEFVPASLLLTGRIAQLSGIKFPN
jgi:tRNA A22 N-methylase